MRRPRSKMFRHRVAAALAAALGPTLAPAAALADTQTSDNWSGYAAHRAGASFNHVQASWRQPVGRCTAGQPAYAAFWVGLGGYSLTSNAMEQIGTELDCTSSGRSRSSAWYELVPSPSRAVKMTIAGGDRMTASVSVKGRRVTLHLADNTRHESFSRTVTARALDLGSAEWIAEAPSGCTATGVCQTLPLANFGSVHFTHARAHTRSGQDGGVSSRWWSTTRIVLHPNPRISVINGTPGSSTPSRLGAAGSAFEVDYAQGNPAAVPLVRRASAAGVPAWIQPGGGRR